MTVKELVDKLLEMDQGKEVKLALDDESAEITNVIEDNDEVEIYNY